jgi:hypothetical protein
MRKLFELFVDLPQVIPHDPAKAREQQPWLTDEEWAYTEVAGAEFDKHMKPFRDSLLEREKWMGDTETAEQTFDKNRRRYPFWAHFILTTDFKIVEEPNSIRWSLFLEKAEHRRLEFTTVSSGVPKKRAWSETPWAEQMRARRKREAAPPIQVAEVAVSTVFIGTGSGEMFETMIFGGWQDGNRYKSATLIDAKRTHYAAVDLARKAIAYLRKHGRARRKDWVRMADYWRLAVKRGKWWALKHAIKMEQVDRRLSSIPGNAQQPQPPTLHGLLSKWMPQESIIADPLMDPPGW